MGKIRLSPPDEAILHKVLESELSNLEMLELLKLEPRLLSEDDRKFLMDLEKQIDSQVEKQPVRSGGVHSAQRRIGKRRFIGARQTTIAGEVEISGTGLHSGAPVSVVLHPAPADTGLCFIVSKRGRIISQIEADIRAVRGKQLHAVLGDDRGVTVETVEHLLSALRGLSVDNCFIEIDNREVPIMDGSAAIFVDAISKVWVRELAAPRKFIKVLKPVRVQDGKFWSELNPHSGFHMDVEIDFDEPAIGRQRLALDVSPGSYRRELARARTFGFLGDFERLLKAGFALGASLANSVAIDGKGKICNPDGLRFPNEFVRYKIMNAIGWLALAGAPILGQYRSFGSTGANKAKLLEAFFADSENWAVVHAPREVDHPNVEAFPVLTTGRYLPNRA